jgi:hypothetical protein
VRNDVKSIKILVYKRAWTSPNPIWVEPVVKAGPVEKPVAVEPWSAKICAIETTPAVRATPSRAVL